MHSESRQYRVLSAIGRGGFGTVFQAEMIGSGGFSKPVALKVLNPEVEGIAEIASRLRDEGRILGRLRHRAIVRVDGLVNFDGRWAVVMEYVEGVDLKALIGRGPLPAGPALEIIGEVAGAIYAAFEQATDQDGLPLRLLHRDIKPGNIQLTPAGEVKVLDFGIARADFASREATTQSMRFGSLMYMSPERLDFIDTHKGDVYAVGAVLFELLSGRALGKTSAKPERHQALLDRALQDLDERGIDPPIIDLVRDCLAYEPGDRPSAKALHRRCRELRQPMDPPWLSDWAEGVVPELMAAREAVDDALCGTVLIEASGLSVLNSDRLHTDTAPRDPSHETFVLEGEPPPEATPIPRPAEPPPAAPTAPEAAVPTPAPRIGRWAAAALLAMATGAYALFGGGSEDVRPGDVGGTDEVADTTEAADGGGRAEERPDSEPGGAVAGEEATPPRDIEGTAGGQTGDEDAAEPREVASSQADGNAGSEASAPEASAPEASTPEASTPEASPSESGGDVPTTGTVLLGGDATALSLITSDGHRLSPGQVPPGRYDLIATFPDAGEVGAGQITVEAGVTITVTCDGLFLLCKPD